MKPATTEPAWSPTEREQADDAPLLPWEVAVSISIERYTVAMALAAFLAVLAAVLVAQGLSTDGGALGLYVGGGLAFAAAVAAFVLARLRLRPGGAPPVPAHPMGISLAAERYTVATSLSTFLLMLAAALLYMGVASSGYAPALFIAGALVVGFSGLVYAAGRRHLRAALEAQGRQEGLAEAEARARARRHLARLLRGGR
jgi:hypothetical protein